MARRDARSLTAAATAAFLAATLALAGAARAEEAEEGQDLETKLKAQMEKVIRLMRENEAALLEASRAGGKSPDGVDVPVPPAPPSGAGAGSPPPGEPPPPERTQEIRRKMDDLIRGSSSSSQAIPKELEELVRMIPQKSGQSESPPSGEDPKDAEARRREQDAPKPEPSGTDKPEDAPKGERDPKDRDGNPPPGSAGDPTRPDVPPWLAELPPEVRRQILNSDFEQVPVRYRKLLERYHKWLSEQAGKPPR